MDSDFQYDLAGICRGCMSNEEDADQSLLEEECGLLFTMCTSLKIDSSDGLPVKICKTCMQQCHSWYAFKQQCEESETILKELHAKNNSIKVPHVKLAETPEDENEDITPIEQEQSEYNSDGEECDFLEDNTLADEVSAPGNTTEKTKPKSQTKKRYICDLCGQFCYGEDRRVAHMRWHSGLKPEVCKICKKEFDNPRALRRHRTKHEQSKKYKCNDCEKVYKYANSLRLHRKSHQSLPRFVCDLCGKSFYRAHGLQSHLLTHTTETPFSCDICGKKFKSKAMLRNHQIRHEGIKKFICSDCGKTFTTSAELVTHERVHSGVKPFGCSLCEKKYKTKSHLAVHMRMHTGERPYACDLCPQKFAHNKVLKQHRMTHTGELPHVCQVCQRPFRQKNTLHVHMRTHHPLPQTIQDHQEIIQIPLDVLEEDGSSQVMAVTIISSNENCS